MGGKGKNKGKGKGKGKGEGEEGEGEGEGEGDGEGNEGDDNGKPGSMVADADNDGKKCKMSNKLRTFKMEGGKASEEACSKACADDAECVAFSAIFGKWCIGCKEALSDNHKGAEAFKKSDDEEGDEGDDNDDDDEGGKKGKKGGKKGKGKGKGK